MNVLTRLFENIPNVRPKKRNSWILPNGILLLFALLPLLWGIVISIVILSQETPGFRLEATQNYFIVSKIDKQINNISEKDCITQISGMGYHSVLGALFDFNKRAFLPQTITIKKSGIEKAIACKTIPITLVDYFKGVWLSFFIVLMFTFLVITALLKSPGEQPADLFLLTFTLFSLIIINKLPFHFGLLIPNFLSFSFFSVTLAHWLAFSAWTHFVLQFPVERQFLTGRPLITTAIYLLPPVVAICMAGMISSGSGNFWGILQHYRHWATPGFIVGTLLKHIIDYWKIKSPLAKSQLKLMMCGGFTGIAPYLFLYLLPNIIFDQPFITFHVVILVGLLIPLAIFRAIILYNLMDVDQLISKGITYV
ncbi:hypothetical protein QUF70_18780, partial [Desulfobacterales bacterium HSG17]|nr:hypothetical protein [Desulfobacterales bacterium HSG17]